MELAEGQEVEALAHGDWRRSTVTQLYPGSTYVQVKPVESPWRIPTVIPAADVRPL